VKTPIFGAGLQAKSLNVSSQERVNFYADIQAVEDKTRIVYYGTPGLALFTDELGDTPVRGMISVDELLYVVHRGTFYEINNSASVTSRGSIASTSGRVDMSYNGTQILMTDGTTAYTYTISSTTLAAVSDAQFPDAATTCTWQDGYSIVEFGSDFYISALDDATSWTATDLASAESNPDDIERVFAYQGQLVLFGPLTTEFWGNVGNADFPYARIGGGVIQTGLAAKWSVAEVDGGLMFLGQNEMGDVQIYMLRGYQATPVSTADLEVEINGYATNSDATALSYRHSGHGFYQINFPTEGKSWLYDATTGLWSRLKYGINARHRAEIGTTFLNKIIVSDYENGKLYRLEPEVYTDNGDILVSKLVSKHLFDHDYVSIYELWLDAETGVGTATGQGSSPYAMLRVSKDGGHSWGNELWASLGPIGTYKTRLIWRRLGRARDWVFEVAISDPVKRVIMGEGWV
jgi:hypothetical protein